MGRGLGDKSGVEGVPLGAAVELMGTWDVEMPFLDVTKCNEPLYYPFVVLLVKKLDWAGICRLLLQTLFALYITAFKFLNTNLRVSVKSLTSQFFTLTLLTNLTLCGAR